MKNGQVRVLTQGPIMNCVIETGQFILHKMKARRLENTCNSKKATSDDTVVGKRTRAKKDE